MLLKCSSGAPLVSRGAERPRASHRLPRRSRQHLPLNQTLSPRCRASFLRMDSFQQPAVSSRVAQGVCKCLHTGEHPICGCVGHALAAANTWLGKVLAGSGCSEWQARGIQRFAAGLDPNTNPLEPLACQTHILSDARALLCT